MGEPSEPGSGRRRVIALDAHPLQEGPTKRMRGATATSPSGLHKKKKAGRGKKFKSIQKEVRASRPQTRPTSEFRNDRDRVIEVKRKFRECVRHYQEKDYVKPHATASTYIKENHPSLVKHSDLIKEGTVPGVEVGDKFCSRAELALVNLHRPPQSGIDTKEIDDRGTPTLIATSIVLSGKYEDDEDEGDTLLYTGEGGRDAKTGKQVEDQAMKGGNLALYNSMKMRTPVRVIRNWPQSARSTGETYSYDGLYTVEKCEVTPGKSNFNVYTFRVVRAPGQPDSEYPPYVKRGQRFNFITGRY